ncbi:hypothetical protein CHLRE_02g099500v5 [Chlamydomonas reinhardtii]|uniref:Uncharacterized protein n=1 Tax=Chlamydomonas reinhardtii TaxID=3055 RepID=A0A2K3E278_CHLRE|nr:uncharacterized protein CHLRE_02g099500v5 [Chlamydomonas reinhardtii]XP_042927322.1 uncharacterized protein CHLRE_02g099500v5 [Chlamydomonas reinhardtii]PNW86876.1 hypothetical protein CHLRE_02g099500v5 [Chlamydomonas reinhardtii]PNW86877.1 hypothetical protein CHLRE_02g099500v5 [Chlamydomonas reinhardtii]
MPEAPVALDVAGQPQAQVPESGAAQQQAHAPAQMPDIEAAVVGADVVVKEDSSADEDEHVHYAHRAPWLRAFVLGANDGLVSVAALMLGVGGGSDDLSAMRLAGIASWVAGALSMALGEYVSVASQLDTEEADIEKERQQQLKGPAARAHELQELTEIYIGRGLTPELARQVAEQLTEKDVIRAHARDELGIDMDAMANPLQAAVVSCIAFTAGALIPLLAGSFIHDPTGRLVAVALVAVLGLAVFGLTGSLLGGAKWFIGASRVVIGGCLAMGVTFGVGRALGAKVT